MNFEKSQRKMTKKALLLSLALHAILFIAFLASSLATSKPVIVPRRLIVQSISLTQFKKTSTQIASLPTPPKVEKQSEPVVKAEKEEEPLPTEESSKEESIVQKASSSEESQAEPEPIPKDTKPVCEKVLEKAQQKKPQKAQAPKKAPSTKKISTQKLSQDKKTAAKQKYPSYNQKLVEEALKRLDKSKSIAGSGHCNSKTPSTKKVQSVGSLNVDQGVSSPSFSEDSPYDGYTSSSPEAHYIADLIRRLQLNIRLPEHGEVRVKLTLNRTGTVTTVTVLSGKTDKIKKAIVEKLRTISFSSFGRSFSNESEHTFLLRLSNDLLWSCG
jgi:colicin import membrane protein